MNPSGKSGKKRLINVGNAAALLVGTALIGQVLGFLRTKLVNSNFPVTGPQSTDAYFAAFIIPDFFFFTLAAGALGVAFMPVLAERYQNNDNRGVWELSSSLLNLLSIIMAIVGIIMMVFAEQLIRYIVAPHLASRPEELNNATTILRLIALNPLLFTITGILTSVQQTMGRFFFYAVAPLFYNLSIIASIYLFRDNIGLIGLGVGALIGAVAQLIIVFIGAVKLNFRWSPAIHWKSPDFKTILRNLPPRSLDQGADQINSIVETRIASNLGAGNITYYNNAYTLSAAPIMLIGTAVSTAAFPRLNQRLSQGRPDLFRKDFLMVLRAMIWVSAPIVVICFFSRGYLARLIFARGNNEIAVIFGFLTIAIFFRIIYAIISRWFYAQKDTKTPLFVSLFIIALNIILAYSLAKPDSYGVAGLALAQSIVAAAEVAILFVIMLLRDHHAFDMNFWNGVIKIFSVTGFSLVAGFIMISLYPLGAADRGFITLGSKLAFISIVVLGVHVLVSSVFGLEEVRPIFRRLKRLIMRPVKF